MICKIHSKKSEYRQDGDEIRQSILNKLLEEIDILQNDNNTGILTPQHCLIPHTDKNMLHNQRSVDYLCKILKIKFTKSTFPAGSMFWFKPEALKGLTEIPPPLFEPEEGLADGTTAHGIERLFCLLAEKNGFSIKGI